MLGKPAFALIILLEVEDLFKLVVWSRKKQANLV